MSRDASVSPTAPSAWRHLPLALVLGVSLYASGFWLVGQPGQQPIEQAGEKILSQWQPGDAVAVRPWWAARLREQLGDKPFYQARDLEVEDLSRHRRLWLVSLPGHHRNPFPSRGYRLAETLEFGSVLLRRYHLPDPAEVIYDFRARLQQAKVRIRQKDKTRECTSWIEDRWMCTPRDWNYVGRMIVELGDDPREIIWAHPTDEGALEISYARVPGGRELLVQTGLTPPAARTPDGTPVELEVLVDGKSIAKLIQPNRTGLMLHPIPFSKQGPGSHEVTFRIRSPRAGMRHFCFTAEVRR